MIWANSQESNIIEMSSNHNDSKLNYTAKHVIPYAVLIVEHFCATVKYIPWATGKKRNELSTANDGKAEKSIFKISCIKVSSTSCVALENVRGLPLIIMCKQQSVLVWVCVLYMRWFQQGNSALLILLSDMCYHSLLLYGTQTWYLNKWYTFSSVKSKVIRHTSGMETYANELPCRTVFLPFIYQQQMNKIKNIFIIHLNESSVQFSIFLWH